MATERITFPGSEGSILSARVEHPLDGRARAWALFAHCFTCSKSTRAAVEVSRGLSGLGVGVVRFDFTGLGDSEGDFADTNFSSNVSDIVAAARYMAERLDPPSILVGHSLGGAAVLQAAAQLPSVEAVVTIGAPADPAHVLRHISASADEIERTGEASVEIAGRPFRIKKQFLDDLRADRMDEAIADLDRALMIFHSPVDEVVGIDNAARIFEMAKHPKSFVSLDRADHLLTNRDDAAYVASVLAAWARKYVPDEGEADAADLAEEQGTVTRTSAGELRTDVVIGPHALVADEPTSVGGENAGPTPYDFVVAGLGSCTSMTLQMYARRKEWPLEEVIVRLRHTKVHARDCEHCEGEEDARLDRIDLEVELVGPLDEAQRARLLEIADRCPVHRTLHAGVRVATTLKGATAVDG